MNLKAKLRQRIDIPAFVVAGLAFALYCAYSLYQWKHFVVPSWDLGIFTELAQNYANATAPIVDIKGANYNLLGDHFHPLLVLLGLIYRLFPSGLTLLVVQNFLFALSSVPLTRHARTRLGSRLGVLVGVAYVLSFGLLEAIKSQFHEVAFAVPLLAYGLVSWADGRKRVAFIELGLLVFVKEDLGLTLVAFGLIELWIEWGKHGCGYPARTPAALVDTFKAKSAVLPVAFIVWGAVWFALAIAVILPFFSPSGAWEYTGNLGNSSASSGFLEAVFGFFMPGEKMMTLFLLACLAGLVGLRSPYMWLMVPTLAWRFAGNVSYYWGWQWHYSAVLMPIAIFVLVDGVRRLENWERMRDSWGDSWRGKLRGFAVAVSLVTSLIMAWSGPFGQYLRGEMWAASDEEITAAHGAIEAVGTSHVVVTDLTLLAYLVPGNRVFWEGTVGGGDGHVDTVVATPHSQVMHGEVELQAWAAENFGGTWEVVYDVDGYTVAQRTA
ncbi:MAG: DUF2079 domain-containing protein [Actinomycetaceae bacterium]|nr:DUF2079 domain-containing protein [Actinomycetaceae bacterium]